MKARKEMSARLTTQPAVAKALGMVNAPVPTIRLNMYTSPTWKNHTTETQTDRQTDRTDRHTDRHRQAHTPETQRVRV